MTIIRWRHFTVGRLTQTPVKYIFFESLIRGCATNLIITTPRTSCISFLHKIHKPNNPVRPIVSACSCHTKLIFCYLANIMVPIVRCLPSCVKDSQHALQIFRHFNFLGEDKLTFTMDITDNGECLRFTHC